MSRRHFLTCLPPVLLSAALAMPMAGAAEPAVQRMDARIPVWVPASGDSPAHRAELAGHVYRPQGQGPWGLIVLSHGTPSGKEAREAMTDRYGPQASALAELGYVVVTGLRRGYGASDGPLADRYGSCDAPDYAHAAQEAARDVAAIMTYGQKLPYVDGSHVLLLGKSAGGFASLALAAQQPAGLRGVVNFAGGRGSQPQMREKAAVCGEAQLLKTVAGFAATSRVPQLWIYAENDSYFRPPLVRKMAQSYLATGQNLKLVFAPSSGAEGHQFFDRAANIGQWLPQVREFLMQQLPGTAAAQLQNPNSLGDKP
ncbi:CocE/NonD family hydrolase [Comamonas testosteroni]|uniref:alpha/beta hydrolase family protein n=1 Tax=Comamonas testosteroni TaxID=285 RepID=UPI00265E1BA8|nr:CocE/NonD family hydrolase [Comamonas testosteroni]WKL17742.1 CocE/NonD family hydrolase [Comamonas testosteroni]WQD43750.1 CocE/NonD family hydrolase [Comamonas testosteroni]